MTGLNHEAIAIVKESNCYSCFKVHIVCVGVDVDHTHRSSYIKLHRSIAISFINLKSGTGSNSKVSATILNFVRTGILRRI